MCVFCKQNAKMTKFVRKIVIFEFCKQNTLTVTLCRMPEPYLSFLQTEFKNVILAIFFVNILLGAPELWCPGTRSLVPFQADQGKGHQSSGARDFLAGQSPLRGEGGYPLSGIFPLLGFLNPSLRLYFNVCQLSLSPEKKGSCMEMYLISKCFHTALTKSFAVATFRGQWQSLGSLHA